MSSPESRLAGMRPQDVIVHRALVLGWYDGPLEGFIDLSQPESSWYFQLMGERYEPGDIDSRLYLLSHVPAGVIDQITELAGEAFPAARKVWVPSWQFPDPAREQAADDVVNTAIAEAKPGRLIVHAKDLTRMTDFWITTTPLRLPRQPIQ